MEVIFNDQLLYQRDIINAIGRSRRKWKTLYHWFPEEQRRLHKETERIYNEPINQQSKEMFMDYCQERGSNKRIINGDHHIVSDKQDYEKFPTLKPILDKYGRFPLLYYDQENFEQQQNTAL